MVLGIRSKSRKNVAIRVEYLIHIQEIKPWPLSQSQKSAQSIVFLQWENGDRPSGSVTSEVGDGRIEFAESFRLPITLNREASRKGAAHDSYQKNILEFFLYEPRKDKPTKGQLLGTAVINLADYGIVKETIAITAPMNCKKISKNSGQPVLHINIQPSGNEGNDSVSEATGEGNDEEGEIAAFTDDDVDDDVSSHSSLTTTSSTQYSAKTEPETSKDNVEGIFREPSLAFRTEPASTGSSPPAKLSNHLRISLPPLPSIGHSNPRNSANDSAVSSYVPQEKSMPILKKSVTHGVRYSSSSLGYQDNPQNWGNKRLVDNSWKMPEYVQESTRDNIVANPTNNAASSSKYIRKGMNGDHIDSKVTQEDERKYWSETKNGQEEARVSDSLFSPSRDNGNKNQQENGKKDNLVKLKENSFDVKQASRTSLDSSTDYSCTYSNDDIGVPCGIIKNNSKLKHLKSVQLHSDTAKKDRLLDNTEVENPKRTEVSKATHDGGIAKAIGVGKGKTNSSSDSKGALESQIEMLKEELREAAAVEVGLYSVVAEHGSSANKMHAPARRLSRFFFHACKAGSKSKKENAARTAISGFILVSKACGNDVPRLTFWLSNSIMLRASIGQITRKQQCSDGLSVNNNGNGKFSVKGFDNWDDPKTFMIALEKFESWIFSRIVESVWWQTMTPHMQPAAAKTSSSRKASGRKNGIADHERNNFSVELWKKAFKDACQRLCPARAGGHECGCLPVLARLVMEQLVDRLDVAMFNAILRENGEEMPTDPVSDPISDSKVLPIPAGRSSFGAGAQLKNAIGSWSRCLTDIFDIDDGHDDRSELNEKEKPESPTPFKAFRLLNALSDLMMIPFEMLADKSTREEVCPSLSATLIKMILYTFVPDEFCPNPIPETVFEALDSEDDSEVNAESVTSFPCTANPTVYSPPSATSLAGVLGDTGSQALQRSGSSVLRKSYTSDDELDELDLPISSIIKDNLQGKKKGDRKVVRYQLLREVWKDSE